MTIKKNVKEKVPRRNRVRVVGSGKEEASLVRKVTGSMVNRKEMLKGG